MSYLLGIDIGTSSCKVAVFDENGKVIAQKNGEYPVYCLQDGWAEQNPDLWWEAVCESIRMMLEENQIDASHISGIGVDGQSWSAIPIDENGVVLAHTPIWFDTRAKDVCTRLKHEIGEEAIFALCGNPLQPGYTLPKILWFQEKMPEVYQRTKKFLQANSFIVYRLTGIFSQDRSQGYGLHCYDMRKSVWDHEMCKSMNLDTDKLPDIHSCHDVVGAVTQKVAQQTGLTAGIPVVAGGLDAACGALGVGVLNAGETQEQGGQAGGMSICIDRYHADPRLILGNHVVPGRWLLQGGTVGGGGVMRWIEQIFGAEARLAAETNGTNSFYELDQSAQAIPAGSEGVVFLPYMAGERSPIWDEKAKGVYYGLDYSKTRDHLIRAGMEGVAFALRHNIEVAEECGVSVKEMRSMGGAANSRLWTQMKADVTGKNIAVPSSDTATTWGAAMLAGIGIGVYRSFEEAVQKSIHIKREHKVNWEEHKKYETGYQTYLSLYQALKPIMQQK